jgi:hypothetical protein
MRDLADDTCKVRPGCPDDAYLAGRGVYLTSGTRVEIQDLHALGGTDSRRRHPVHRLSIIKLDASKRRVGEASWDVEFHA